MHVSRCVQACAICAVCACVVMCVCVNLCVHGGTCPHVHVCVCMCVRWCGTLGDLKAAFGRGRGIRKPKMSLTFKGLACNLVSFQVIQRSMACNDF